MSKDLNLRVNHPTTVVLPQPIPVSPLLRFARWSALGLGVVWGFIRLRQIRHYHADIREWEFEKKLAEIEEKKKTQKWMEKDQMRILMKEIGLPFDDGVALLGVQSLFREE
ncbi:ATP synthase E chain domain-containing protein [Ditylenchus destructor]|nr:ATP synthase E chain domain-containing protein [Ditylenchus destructor]